MDGPRLTEERLRSHLDSNQVMRERMCLALMPVIGQYTRERPRRPKGGPDGARDIEAVHEGSTVVWGAVGFRNGGGNDDTARREAAKKFDDDLTAALKENASLQAFVFFTNVDLTPTIIEQLKETAAKKGVPIVDVVDFERLRHALDSPEGLIPRLQYLDIPMSATEQIALVSKFGNQLQSAVSERFDRVEQTLSQMERFLAFQKPIYRLDTYVSLDTPHRSSQFGEQGVLLEVSGFQDLTKTFSYLLWNQVTHPLAAAAVITKSRMWLGETPGTVVEFTPSISGSRSIMTSFCELSFTAGGNRVRIADLSVITLNAWVTEGLRPVVKKLALEANGYRLFDCLLSPETEPSSVVLSSEVTGAPKEALWFKAANKVRHDLIFHPPVLAGKFLPLVTF